jgi:hypothetical protein
VDDSRRAMRPLASIGLAANLAARMRRGPTVRAGLVFRSSTSTSPALDPMRHPLPRGATRRR